MRRELERLARDVEARRQAMAALARLLAEDELLPHTVRVEELPSLRACALELTASGEQQEELTTEAARDLQRWAHQRGLPADPLLCEVQAARGGELSLRVCLGVPSELEVEPPPGAELVSLAGGAAASTVHVGPYSQLGLAHHALFAWVHERGHRELGPVRETYHNDPAEVPAGELVTHVAVRIDASA